MIALYRLVTNLIYLLIYPIARSRAARGSIVWQGRLGRNLPDRPVDVWMHAASVGEVKVLANLVTYLQEKRSDIRIHLTTMTSTGHDTARTLFAGSVSVSVFPLDVAKVIKRTLDTLQPGLIIVAETEIWPNLISEAASKNIRMILVNGRMTAKSSGKYRLVSGLLKKLLAKYDRFFFKSDADQKRYQQFGVGPSQAEVTGDMKFDAPLIPRSTERILSIRLKLGVAPEQFLLAAGSTRPGEEVLLLRLHTVLKKKLPQFRLAIAPRHLERIPEIKKLITGSGLKYCCLDDDELCCDVVLVDRMGFLNDLYLAADLAFVGGTLVDIGGHNILEPVWARTPVLFGPSLGNVLEAAEFIERNGYGSKVDDVDQIGSIVTEMIAGQRKFETKDVADLEQSATATVGKYVLRRLANA